MENHPIPQDVSHFQFKLIGDMTIKQFAYLGAGVLLAWVCLASPFFFLFKFFLAVMFAGAGTILAFIPLQGRPADIMVLFFIKALFSPNQYLYQKQGVPTGMIAPSTVKVEEIPTQKKETKKEDSNQTVKLEALPSAFSQPMATPSVTNPTAAAISPAAQKATGNLPEEPAVNQALAQEVATLTKAIQSAKVEEVKETGSQSLEAHKKTIELEGELQQILKQKQDLEKQLLSLQEQLAKKKEKVFTPSIATPQVQTVHVRKIPKTMSTAAGLPFAPDVPNLIMGIVKDPRGNVLPNVLIEVKDKDDNPVRAFKTNPLGQFASATPLVNGVYTISFEDPKGKQRFDTVEINAEGEVLLPIEVISIDSREELRKELFPQV